MHRQFCLFGYDQAIFGQTRKIDGYIYTRTSGISPMMSDQYHVTVGKEKMKIDNLIYFFTRNGSKDCKLTILAVFLEKRSGKKKMCTMQCTITSV